MKTIKTLLTILTAGLVFSSCQKESSLQNGSGNDKIFGTWNLIDMTASMKTTTIAGTGATQEKMISSYDVTAINPVGKITIDANKFVTSGVGYSMNTEMLTEMYIGGVFFDSFEIPLEMTMPSSNASTTYTAIGSDSVYLQSGLISFEAAGTGTGSSMTTQPQGFKISWQNDTMVLKSVMVHNMTQTINGVSAQVAVNANQTVKLKK